MVVIAIRVSLKVKKILIHPMPLTALDSVAVDLIKENHRTTNTIITNTNMVIKVISMDTINNTKEATTINIAITTAAPEVAQVTDITITVIMINTTTNRPITTGRANRCKTQCQEEQPVGIRKNKSFIRVNNRVANSSNHSMVQVGNSHNNTSKVENTIGNKEIIAGTILKEERIITRKRSNTIIIIEAVDSFYPGVKYQISPIISITFVSRFLYLQINNL